MPKKARLSLHDFEQETQKFLAPATDKERAIIEAAADLLGKRPCMGELAFPLRSDQGHGGLRIADCGLVLGIRNPQSTIRN